jgi:hypothetical protein
MLQGENTLLTYDGTNVERFAGVGELREGKG